MESHFHIHADAERISSSFRDYLIKLSFTEKPFDFGAYAPKIHYTFKTAEVREYRKIKEELQRLSRNEYFYEDFTGYFEFEMIAKRKLIEEKEFEPSVRFPFKVESRSPQKIYERKADVHVTLQNTSDEELIKRLSDSGLYIAGMGKKLIFTQQGTRKDMESLTEMVVRYLNSAGGGEEAKVMLEYVPLLIPVVPPESRLKLPLLTDRIIKF